MVSGITGVSHHKRDVLTHIREMEAGGLKLVSWKKYGPFTQRVGAAGIYLFVFRKMRPSELFSADVAHELARDIQRSLGEIEADCRTFGIRIEKNLRKISENLSRLGSEEKKK